MLRLPKACCGTGLFAGYLSLLSQLTKVGDYDDATFHGRAADATVAVAPVFAKRMPCHSCAARFKAMRERDDTYKVVVIEGAHCFVLASHMLHVPLGKLTCLLCCRLR